MTNIKRINPATMAPPGGHYSHAVVANGLVFISGQLPITPAGEKLHQAGFEDQAAQVLANVQAALVAAGSSVANLEKWRRWGWFQCCQNSNCLRKCRKGRRPIRLDEDAKPPSLSCQA